MDQEMWTVYKAFEKLIELVTIQSFKMYWYSFERMRKFLNTFQKNWFTFS